MNELTFKNNTVIPFDNGDGKIWFTAEALADLLGYANSNKVSNIYNRHKDEFTDSMTIVTKVRKCNKNSMIDYTQVRLFSPRGAHLIGMMSRTKIAKELRIWLLDLAARESGVEVGHLNLETLPQLAGQKMLDAIDVFDKKSLKYRGKKGSGLMAQRKRDIKLIKKATEIALQLTQLSIPDLGDFPDGESA